ncbi:hypothetical protein [Vibrio cholerae]|uniref:hypothetical protein n=1 Tax=Vibrio cholerae TaxID=666 RepID=UPI00192E0E83|nr:hypothetical protein [Vibrio cholerae]GFK34059.1 hypothetical protein VcPa01_02211 [Vibrio cholerae]GFK37737.1 hypothetical protein VcPa02_02336 [Vibrio cholerae]GFK41197.1 hypothetical protein VcPa03_02299 [Vibrio cholerae]GFK44658.1 hypothetical protein VcPa04_02211 [Vibrio cholerae]GFK47877.1 hypothetical protein VcPa05_01857 [Vibrio cholerae]
MVAVDKDSNMGSLAQTSSLLSHEAVHSLCQLLGQLWTSGGLTANKAAPLLIAVPALKKLLQPIAAGPVGDTAGDINETNNAYCLSAPLLNAYGELSQLGEWQLALLGLNPEVRAHWLNLAAARCREAGTMSDPQVLIKLIQQLGNASEWVLAQLERADANPQLFAGPLSQLERDLLGQSLNDNAAIPALCRLLRACFTLHTLSEQTEVLAPIQPTDNTAKQLASNWCSGRLLALPESLLSEFNLKQPIKPTLKPHADWLLVSQPVNAEATYIEHFSQQPWWFLLSLLSFVQDAWAAEQRGGLLLTLPAGQNAFSPSQVNVAVQGIDGDEVGLGSLAEFLVQLLSELNIALYPAQTDSAEDMQHLNRALSPLIAQLLANKIWQFLDAGRGEPGQYRIHPDFSDACYSLPLAPLFGYKSQHLQQAIRQLAQTSYANKRSASSANRIKS